MPARGGQLTYETEAVVLRTIRYGEADSVITLYTLARGRVPAIAKGARRPRSKLGGVLQPGVVARVTLAEGKGDLDALRGAQTIDTNAGLWVVGYRLRAAGSLLETAMRVLQEREANEEAFHLLTRALTLVARAPARPGPPRLDPVVLGTQCKLLVVAGLLPRLSACAGCGGGGPLTGFSAHAGGALCVDCDRREEALDPRAAEAMVALVGRPLAEAAEACPPEAGAGVERMVGLVLREHLGVVLRSATPL